MKCRYRYCMAELPWSINGNRRYCDDDCNNAERLEREKEKYAARKTTLDELKRIESLLHGCYLQFAETPFDIHILRALKMNWTLYSGAISVDSIPFRIVGPYAYAAFDDDTVKIITL